MSLWDSEIVKVNGDYFVYARTQNDYTGNISGCFRRIYKDKSGYYAKVDGRNQYFTDKIQAYIQHEDRIKTAMDFYKKYNGKLGL